MPLGELIGEVFIRLIGEFIIHGIAYWTGYLLLKSLSLGRIQVAPLLTIEEKNRNRKRRKQIDWSIWLHRPMQGRALKAEFTCIIGALAWMGAAVAICFATRD